MSHQDEIAERPKRGGANKDRLAEQAIAALLVGRTIKQAAKDCNLGYTTLKRWLSEEWFLSEYRAAKNQLLESVINQLRSLGSVGVEGLRAVASDRKAPPIARASASRGILEVLLRATWAQDVMARLERLEAMRDEGRQR